jgi:hypothetical protein
VQEGARQVLLSEARLRLAVVPELKGGGVYVASGTVTLDGCSIFDDTASVLGSGGSWKPGGVLNLMNNCQTNCTFVVDNG